MIERSSAVLCLPAAQSFGGRTQAGAPEGDDERLRALETELEELAQVATAACIAATAFRLRDEAGLITALRGLVAAVDGLERLRAED
jgi:hypothetical protein